MRQGSCCDISCQTASRDGANVSAAASSDDADAYRADLLDARGMLGDAYGFDDANMGDNNGQNGW